MKRITLNLTPEQVRRLQEILVDLQSAEDGEYEIVNGILESLNSESEWKTFLEELEA